MLSQQTVAELLAALGARTPASASGSAIALTAALADEDTAAAELGRAAARVARRLAELNA